MRNLNHTIEEGNYYNSEDDYGKLIIDGQNSQIEDGPTLPQYHSTPHFKR